jgi:hypothetical protein
VFEAECDPFVEPQPEKGPWNLSSIDKKHCYYPYRLYVDVSNLHTAGIPFKKLERLNIGLSTELLQRKSVVYISDFQAHIIEELLADLPVEKELAAIERRDITA